VVETIHSWPSSLGHPLVSGYSSQRSENLIRTSVGTGPEKIRKQNSGMKPAVVSFSLFVSKAGMQILDDFYEITLNQVGRFYMPDHRRPMRDQDNITIYRFGDTPSYSPESASRWTAKLKLERLTTVSGRFLLDFYDTEVWPTT
jgi:hypothetical protein